MRIIKQNFKFIIVAFLLVFISNRISQAQISTGGKPITFKQEFESLKGNIPTYKLPYVNNKTLQEQVEKMQSDCFSCNKDYWGKGFEVKLDIKELSRHDILEDGRNIWLFRIESENAFGLQIFFDRFVIPRGGKLYIYNEDKSMVLGAFTNINNKSNGKLALQPINGKSITLEYSEPKEVPFKGELRISRIIHDFKGILNPLGPFGTSDPSCEINVACPEGYGWENESSAVALILLYNQSNMLGGVCSGSLVNNTNNDRAPYFLSANHCLEDPDVVNNNLDDPYYWVFLFNHEASTCSGTDWPSYQSISGASVLANGAISDYLLLELSNTPPLDYEVCYSGWDNSPDTSTPSVVGIHHPGGDIKKILIDYSTPSNLYFNLWCLCYTHWHVKNVDVGSAAPGSSGSPLIDVNHRVIGQLHGSTNGNECDPDLCLSYGKFSKSWEDGDFNQWLDPLNIGASTLETYCPPTIDPCNNIITIEGCGSVYRQSFTGGGLGSWNTTEFCGFSTPGMEQIYEFVAPYTGNYSIEVEHVYDAFFVDYAWSTSCNETGWNCIADVHSTGTYGSMSWTAGNTYYILLDDEDLESGVHYFYINCPEPPPQSPLINYHDHLVKDGDGGGIGDSDNRVEPGEEIDLEVELINNGLGDAHNVTATLSTNDLDITITDNDVTWGYISSGNTNWGSDFDFSVSQNCPEKYVLFTLDITSDEGSWTDDFIVYIYPGDPILEYNDQLVKDGDGGGKGDSDNRAEPGEEIDLEVELINNGLGDAHNVTALLSTTDLDITITDNDVIWGSILPGNTDWGSDFDFTVSENCSEKDVLFTLDITSDNGSWSDGFTVHIYPSEPSFEQNVELKSGWNIMSYCLINEDMSMFNFVSPLISQGALIKVQDESGNAIEELPEPVGWIDNIGQMSISEGYKIKTAWDVIHNCTDSTVPLPVDILLTAGWNIMGYPLMESGPALDVFNQLINSNNLLKVQDEQGNAIEELPYPLGWIDNINTLSAGEGYKVKVSNNCIITLEDNSGSKSFVTTKEELQPTYFTTAFMGNGLDHMNVYLYKPTKAGKELHPGDEVGVFDGEVCVGAGVVSGSEHDLVAVKASLNDPTTPEKDGFIEGHPIDIRLWDNKLGQEHHSQKLEVFKGYNSFYEKYGSTVISVDFEESLLSFLGNAYPNPTTDKTVFTFGLANPSKVRLEIFNIMGELITILVDQYYPEGIHRVEWNNKTIKGKIQNPGLYYYRLTCNDLIKTKMLVIQ